MWLLGAIGIGAAMVGGILIAGGLRRVGMATEELTGSVRRFREVGDALEDLRDATDDAIERGRRIRRR
jgi:hypothetical protein